MSHFSQGCCLFIGVLLLILDPSLSQAILNDGNRIKSGVYLSPKMVMGPGSVQNKFFFNVDFPRGHIALKGFQGEIVDEDGTPVPLYETYLHHWVIDRYFQRKDGKNDTDKPYRILSRNWGNCQADKLEHYFGIGSEVRRAETDIPDPYAIEVGNPVDIPEGYEEIWMLNVHAMDTRGVADRNGCYECQRDQFNNTVDEFGVPLSSKPEYRGGFLICYDGTQCKLRPGFQGPNRVVYLRYKVKWVDMDSSVIPAKVYIFDIADTGMRLPGYNGYAPENGCQIEYEIPACDEGDATGDGCVHVKRNRIPMRSSGYVIYAFAHQHTGGLGFSAYGEDGGVICNSMPTYGTGKEAGNEAGYLVKMSACYPKPGTVKVTEGEHIIIESNYSRDRLHTGVMGHFYFLVTERIHTTLDAANQVNDDSLKTSTYVWTTVGLLVVAMTVAAVAHLLGKKETEDAYEPILP